MELGLIVVQPQWSVFIDAGVRSMVYRVYDSIVQHQILPDSSEYRLPAVRVA